MQNMDWAAGAWRDLLRTGLSEDCWQWDWTTLGSLKRGSSSIRAVIVAKSDGIWAAEGLSSTLDSFSTELGSPILVKSQVKDGERLKAGDVICEWIGPARTVLALERPFLNLAAYAGGIATSTRRLVNVVESRWNELEKIDASSRAPRLTATRKILPAYRDLAIHAVRVGGGWSHRTSLSGGILIKENHITAAGGISGAIQGVRAVAPHGLKLEVEVKNQAEVEEALSQNADGLLLDNFTPAQVKTALKMIKKSEVHPFIEVSGGLNEVTIGDYVLEGVDVLSSGSMTHSVKSLDLSLLVQ